MITKLLKHPRTDQGHMDIRALISANRAGLLVATLLVATTLFSSCSNPPPVQESATAEPPISQPVQPGTRQLAGTAWQATTILGRAAGSAESTIGFISKDSVQGNAGCNTFTGEVRLLDDTIEVGKLAVTRMLCPPSVSGQETVFLEALTMADTWSWEGDELALIDDTGNEVLRFTAR